MSSAGSRHFHMRLQRPGPFPSIETNSEGPSRLRSFLQNAERGCRCQWCRSTPSARGTHSSPTGDSRAWPPQTLSLGLLGHIPPPPSLAPFPSSFDPVHPSILQGPARSPFLLEVFPDCNPVNLCLFSSKPHEHSTITCCPLLP